MQRFHIVHAAMAIVVGAIIYMFFLNVPLNWADSKILHEEPLTTKGLEHSARQVVHLYFADRDNSFLISEERSLFLSSDPAEAGKQIIDELIHGPEQGLMKTIPSATKLRALYVTRDGTAYVDLSGEIKEQHPGGVKSEFLTIYSIVNSLILNISEINAVKILIGGSEALTLAGHIDLSSPFNANMLLIR